MKPVNNTNEMNRADYNRQIAKAAAEAARYAIDAEDSDHYDLDQACGDAMNEVWDDGYKTHRNSILEFASHLPDDLSIIHDVYGPESTEELLDCIAREALQEDIYMFAWRFQEFANDIRRKENELQSCESEIDAE